MRRIAGLIVGCLAVSACNAPMGPVDRFLFESPGRAPIGLHAVTPAAPVAPVDAAAIEKSKPAIAAVPNVVAEDYFYTISYEHLGYWNPVIDALSIASLARAMRATCYTDTGALIRIEETDGKGSALTATCDQAYLLRDSAGDGFFVLGDAISGGRNAEEFVIEYSRGVIREGHPEDQSNISQNDLRKVLSDPARGDVYELWWTSNMSGGTGHWVSERVFVLLRSPKGAWRVLVETTGGSSGSGSNESVKLEFAWNRDVAAKNPVEVTAAITQSASEGVSAGVTEMVTIRHAKIGNDGRIARDGESRLLVCEGETWELLAAGLNDHVYEYGAKTGTKLEARIIARIIAAIKEANPTVKALSAGIELEFPNEADTRAALDKIVKESPRE